MHSKFHTIVLGGLTLLGVMFSPVVSAHTGDPATGLFSGLLHPFSGADHLLMIIAVGIYSARSNNPLHFTLPCVFLMALTTGAQFGTNAFSVQVLETGVVVSLLAAGLLLILAKTNASIWPIVLVLFVAVMSGLAHGLEIAPGGAGLTFIAGFVASSATLLMTCLWIGFILAPIKIESSQLPTAE